MSLWPHDPATAETPVAKSAGGVRKLAAGSHSLADVDARSSVCRACPRLVAWREEVAHTKRRAYADDDYWGRPVPGFGDQEAPILIIGLAPAAHGANRTGRLFTGDRSGDWLFAALHRAGLANQSHSVRADDGLELTGARIVSLVRCAPPANKPTPEERGACTGWLDREIALITPSVRSVVVLGGMAWQATCAALVRSGWDVPRPRPSFGHGATTFVRNPDGTDVMLIGSYHVSQQNTFTGKLTEEMLDDVFARSLNFAIPDRD